MGSASVFTAVRAVDSKSFLLIGISRMSIECGEKFETTTSRNLI